MGGIGRGGIDAASAREAVARRGLISRVGWGRGASLERGGAPLAVRLMGGVVLDGEIVVMITVARSCSCNRLLGDVGRGRG